MKRFKQFSIILLLLSAFTFAAYAQNFNQDKKEKQKISQKTETLQKQVDEKYKATFIELGSVRCILCQKMQPIMKSIEEKFAGQVKEVFHDACTPHIITTSSLYQFRFFWTKMVKAIFDTKDSFPKTNLLKY